MNTIFKYNSKPKVSKDLKGGYNGHNFSVLDVYLNEEVLSAKIQLLNIFKGARKLNFIDSSCVVIILLNTGLPIKNSFFAFLRSRLFFYSVLNAMSSLYRIVIQHWCNHYLYRCQVFCDFVLTKDPRNKASCSHFI